MLSCESLRAYIVYPSWAEGQLPCSWEELPGVLSNPERSRFFDENDRQHLLINPNDYYRPPQPFRCLSGPFGGGIIEVQISARERWLPYIALRHIADLRNPPAMSYLAGFRPRVSYLEPIDIADEAFRLIGTLTGYSYEAPRIYMCHITAEHSISAGNKVYLVVASKHVSEPLRGLAELPTCMSSFGLALSPPIIPPSDIREEIEAWFTPAPTLVKTWFELSDTQDRLNYSFAVVLYAGLYLRYVSGDRLFSIHLIGNIAEKPNYIRHWWRQ